MNKLKSLKVKIPLTIISVVVVFIAALIVITDIKASESLKKTALDGYNNIVFGYASLIDTWFDEQIIIAETYGSNKELMDYLKNGSEAELSAPLIAEFKIPEFIIKPILHSPKITNR